MEIVNIEAKTFQEMLDALFDLEKEFKLLRNQHPNCQLNEWLDNQEVCEILTYIIHSGFISGYQNRYGDNLKPPTNVYHRMTA